jgi:hypothetical protein
MRPGWQLLATRTPISQAVLMTAVLLAAAPVAPTQREDAAKIVERSVETFKRDWAAEPRYDCSERDKDKKGIRTFDDLMLYGSQYQKLTALNDKPLDSRQQAEQQAKLEEAMAERRSESKEQRRRRIAKYQAERKHATDLLLELTKAFDFTLAGTEKIDGRDVYVLIAEPRKGYHPTSMSTRILTGMRGKLWIDRGSYHWAKVDVQVFHPVSIGGFLARVETGTRFEFEQQPVSSDVWLPSRFAVHTRSKFAFMFNHQSDEENSFSNYRAAATPIASAESTRRYIRILDFGEFLKGD